MAITKLMHMKESPGIPHEHLAAAIRYILDVKNGGAKTEDGLFVGGNSGYDAGEILETFLRTKEAFGKPGGRQGYHFVISFAPGETDAVTAYNVTRDFCEQYLGDNYDYVFATHTDQNHIHSHIIFNSVSRVDGYKYHYKEGDWARYIQPVTDKVCQDYGLAPLTFETERIGVSYAQWAEMKKGTLNWSHIIRADIDYAISKSSSFSEFEHHMKQMNYSMRMGFSRKLDKSYVTYTFTDDEGKKHSRRSYKLPDGYGLDEVAQRIRSAGAAAAPDWMTTRLSHAAEATVSRLGSEYKKSTTYRRLYQAVNYYRLPNPYAVPAGRVRKDMLNISGLLEECRFLKTHAITSREKLDAVEKNLKERFSGYQTQRKTLYGIRDLLTKEESCLFDRYENLKEQLRASDALGTDRFEEIEDEMRQIESRLPYDIVHADEKIKVLTQKMRETRKELALCRRIQRTEHDAPGIRQLSPKQ